MKKKILAVVAGAMLASAFSAQAITTVNLADFDGTLIDNKWQKFSFSGPDPVRTSEPFVTTSSDGTGTMTISPIVNFNDNSHIHVNGGSGAGSDATPFIHGDVGGVYFDGTGSLNTFSFQSMDVNNSVLQAALLNGTPITHPNQTITVRGFLGGTNGMETGTLESDGVTMKYDGGSQVAETTVANGFTGNIDFLAIDSGFGEVDYVEFFFTDFYGIKPSSTVADAALLLDFDNVVVGAAVTTVVPVPAAVWFFGTGIMGLLSFGKKKQNTLSV